MNYSLTADMVIFKKKTSDLNSEDSLQATSISLRQGIFIDL